MPAEFGVDVIDAYQRLGIEALSLRHLLKPACHSGVRDQQADILASNRNALHFFVGRGFKPARNLGWRVIQSLEGGTQTGAVY